MKTIILVIIISFAFGQVPQPMAGIEGVWSIVYGDSTFIFNGDTGEDPNYAKRMWHNFYHKTPITMGMVFDYEEECYNDTLRAKEYVEGYIVEYIVEIDGMLWMMTGKQLEDKGYFYQYRWITNTVIDEEHPMEFEYIFVKEPTLKGFGEWLKE